MTSLSVSRGLEALARMKAMNWEDLKKRCRHRLGWTDECTLQVLEEYQRFLALKVATEDYDDKNLLAPAMVEQMWHLHILGTAGYVQDCKRLLGKAGLIKQNIDSNSESKFRAKRIRKTLGALYLMFDHVESCGQSSFQEHLWTFEEAVSPKKGASEAARPVLSHHAQVNKEGAIRPVSIEPETPMKDDSHLQEPLPTAPGLVGLKRKISSDYSPLSSPKKSPSKRVKFAHVKHKLQGEHRNSSSPLVKPSQQEVEYHGMVEEMAAPVVQLFEDHERITDRRHKNVQFEFHGPNGEIEMFELLRGAPMEKAFKKYAQLKGSNRSDLTFYLPSACCRLDPKQTPRDLLRSLRGSKTVPKIRCVSDQEPPLMLKVVGGGQTILFKVKQTTRLQVVCSLFADKVGLERSTCHFFIASDLKPVLGHETPAMMSMQNNDVIRVVTGDWW